MTAKVAILCFGLDIPSFRDVIIKGSNREDAEIVLWDLSGQSRFSNLWGKMIESSQAVIVAVDISIEYVIRSKKMISLVKEEIPHALLAIIVVSRQKQNDEEIISRILDTPVFYLNLGDSASKRKTIEFVSKIIHDSSKVIIPKPEPEKKPPKGSGLLFILRAWLRMGLSKDETLGLTIHDRVEEIVRAIEKGSDQALLDACKILSDANISDQTIDRVLKECREVFQGETS